MPDRRSFLRTGALAPLFLSGVAVQARPGRASVDRAHASDATAVKPIVVSTWDHGLKANAAAWEVLSQGGRALDAVEAGVRDTESDPAVQSVGYGGLPDRDGHVTLDACIMNELGDCGSVAFLQHIKNPVSVARLVMEKTPHVMLVGEGALAFAEEHGFVRENLLTEEAELAWRRWMMTSDQKIVEPPARENHDTIGMLALDGAGDLSGACTTSGLAWKMPGRVGDSPIIGAGLYVDNQVGAACATGMGEAIIRVVGSHLVVELMRQGHEPGDACRLAVERVIQKNPKHQEIQVGFLALDRTGRYGAYSLDPGFECAVYERETGNRLLEIRSHR